MYSRVHMQSGGGAYQSQDTGSSRITVHLSHGKVIAGNSALPGDGKNGMRFAYFFIRKRVVKIKPETKGR